jgi:hypothetical protein
MTTVLAVIRPDDWKFPLLVHVFGAILLMGALLVSGWSLLSGWRKTDATEAVALTRFGLWSLLLGVVPAWIVMRVGAEWIYDREGFTGDDDPDWLGIGYIASDLGGLLLLISIVLSIIGLRRLRADTIRSALGRIVAVVALVMLVIYAISVWAMTAKPG